MTTIIIPLVLVVAVFLVLVILTQNSKGGGLTGEMSGAASHMGARSATDFIEKATWGLLTAFFVLSIAANLATSPATTEEDALDDLLPAAESVEQPAMQEVESSLPAEGAETLEVPAEAAPVEEEAPAAE